jgi:mannose PTS system EIID component
VVVKRVSGLTLWRVLWRSLFIQAGYNAQLLQSLGFVYALSPALRRLYPTPEAQGAAVRRHLVPFNTHPYVAAAIVGGALALEEKVAAGEAPPEKVTAYKSALMGPLAALGDSFFWHSLRPAVGAVSAALVPMVSAWAALIFLVVYNTVHLTFRARFFLMGYGQGEKLVESLARAHLPRWSQLLRSLAAFCSGGLAAWLAVAFGTNQAGALGAPLAAGCLLAGLAAYELVKRRVSPYAVLYAVALLAFGAGATL